MVKGVSKRVVVVRFPDTRVFEQAIFIVREDGAARHGISADNVLHEACKIADGYVQRNRRLPKRMRFPPPVYLSLGAAVTGLAWLLSVLLH